MSNIQLKNEDIVIILSNLLNNAIEACEQCTKNRRIKINLQQKEKELIISVQNIYEQALLIENGEYKTTSDMLCGIFLNGSTYFFIKNRKLPFLLPVKI